MHRTSGAVALPSSNGAAMSAAVELAVTYVEANPGAMTALEVLDFVRACYTQLAAVQTGMPVSAGVGAEAAEAADASFKDPVPPRPVSPAVPVRESVAADGSYIVCLEDGVRLKMLKRYLRRFNLTPQAYRERWGLPSNYPMTAPAYSAAKAKEAKDVGLGSLLNKQGVNVGLLEHAPAA